MTNYNKLINKYYKSEGKNNTEYFKINSSEKRTPSYNKKLKKQEALRNRYLILDSLLNEIPFHISLNQVQQVKYWLFRFNDNFKNFNRRVSNETIILAFIFIQYMKVNPKRRVDDYPICEKYDLTQSVFLTIQNRLIFELMRTTELVYTQSNYYNHEYLIKNGGA